MIVAGYYGFTLDVRVSVRPSFPPSVIRPSVRFSFPDDNLSKLQRIFTNLVCALILWRSGLVSGIWSYLSEWLGIIV